MKKDFWALALIFLATAAISLPLAKPGLYLIHDDQQIARLFLFDQALRAGQFPVRWVDGLGFGFGYPLFVFYPPAVYILGEIFHTLGFGFIDSVKLVFFASILGSGIAMYILGKEFWGRLAGIIAALFYLLVPYRAIDVYIRGALAESFSFVWLPAILWSFYKLQKTNRVLFIYLSAIFLAFLMITHNLVFLPFMLILPLYLLFLFWKSESKKKIFIFYLLSFIFALGLSAFFWLPVLVEKKFAIVDQLLLVSLANYNIHFVYPQQLWNWTWGFGGSAAGLADGLSFKIGKLHILASVLALLFTIVHLIKNKIPSRQLLTLRSNGEGGPIFNLQFSIVCFTLLFFAALMATFYSKPIWDLIPPLAYLQFPWRFLMFTALFASMLAGSIIYLLKLPILRMLAAIVLLFLLVLLNFKLFKPQQYRENLTDEIATSPEVINWYVSGSSFEYLPKGVELYQGELGTNLVRIDKNDIPQKKVEIIEGFSQITNLKTESSQIQFMANVAEFAQIKVNIFSFPGWQVKVDGQEVPIDNNNRLKLITFNIPQGIHQINLEFKNTIIRQIANLISLFSILFLIFLIIKKWPKLSR